MNNFDPNNFIESISKKEGLASIVEHIINSILIAQREDFLLQHNDSKNGFHPRSLNTSLSKLNLNVPRTRYEKFFPPLLQKYNRSDDSYFNLVANLLFHGRSKETIF